MKLYLNYEEITIEELRKEYNQLETGPADGGDFEEIILDEIDSEGNLYFLIGEFNSF